MNLTLTSRSALVILALLLAGCGSHRLNTFEPVDLSERSITVPPGGGLTGEIKQAMTRDGWRVVVRQGPEVTKGQLGENTRLERFKTVETRYVMFLRWNQFDVCVPRFVPAYNYDISVMDVRSGSEVLTLSGRGCEPKIVEKLMEALQARK